MPGMNRNYARLFGRLAVAAAFTFGVGACSTIADLDPTGLLGDDSGAAPSTQFPSGDAPPTADSEVTTPDLAGIPAAPPPPSANAQQQVAQSLATDGAQARYSADALRAGTEAAAAPPPSPDSGADQALAAALPPTAEAPPTADMPPSADVPPSADMPPTAEAVPQAVPQAASEPATAAPPTPAPTRTAALPPPPVAAPPTASLPPAASLPEGTEPAVPAVPPGGRAAMLASAAPSDAALGFKPSSAPPLDSNISRWVPSPILSHYRQTAARAGSAGTEAPAAGPSAGKGPGDVVANLGAVPGTPAGMIAAMNGGVAPTEIIYFPGDTTGLSSAAHAKIRDAVAAFKAQGGTGQIKVVGHASSRTGNMTVERHLEVIFDKSQKRANAVAQALIKAGIPAGKVIIQAVGDSQPIYYESMPKGEDGNRRAEIFLQG
jgi:outer membrane protein OmpA-like peptidoglycan-associated protein